MHDEDKEIETDDDLSIFIDGEDHEFCKEMSRLFYKYGIDTLKEKHTFMIADKNNSKTEWVIIINHIV